MFTIIVSDLTFSRIMGFNWNARCTQYVNDDHSDLFSNGIYGC